MERYTKLDCLIDLRRRILSTELKPGHDLDEARLSDYYSMSRKSVVVLASLFSCAREARISTNQFNE